MTFFKAEHKGHHKLINKDELAHLLGVKVEVVDKLVREKLIPYMFFDRKIRFHYPDVMDALPGIQRVTIRLKRKLRKKQQGSIEKMMRDDRPFVVEGMLPFPELGREISDSLSDYEIHILYEASKGDRFSWVLRQQPTDVGKKMFQACLSLIEKGMASKEKHYRDLYQEHITIVFTAKGKEVSRLLGLGRKTHSQKIKDALQKKKRRGERLGQIPYGFRLSDDGVSLEPHPLEQNKLTMMKEMNKMGTSIRGICSILNAQGIKSRGKKWHPTTVARLLKRE